MTRSFFLHENGLPFRSMTVWRRFSTPDTAHGPFGLGKVRLPDAVTQLLAKDHPAQAVRKLIVPGPSTNPGLQIMFNHAEEAGADFTVSGDSQPVAMTAERLGHRGDDTNLPLALSKGPAAGVL
jgi:hypothetical protein